MSKGSRGTGKQIKPARRATAAPAQSLTGKLESEFSAMMGRAGNFDAIRKVSNDQIDDWAQRAQKLTATNAKRLAADIGIPGRISSKKSAIKALRESLKQKKSTQLITDGI